MTGDDPRVREAVRSIADAAEARAIPEEEMATRLEERMRRPQLPALALVGVVAVVLLAAMVWRVALPDRDVGGVMPTVVGLFQSVEPDSDGRCVAVRLYETTPADGRVAVWAWTGADGCEGRSSNLFTGLGSARAVPMAGERTGIRIQAAAGATGPLDGLVLVLDPGASAGEGEIAGFWDASATSGPPTLLLRQVEEVVVPYRP